MLKKTPLDEIVSDDEYYSKQIHYLNSELQVELEFNKSLMNLSAGALVLSITVMQLFLGNGNLIFRKLLWGSWFFLFASTLFCLSFFKIVQNSLRKKNQKLEYMYRTEPPERYDQLSKTYSRDSIEDALGVKKWSKLTSKIFKGVVSFHVIHFSKIISVLFMAGVTLLIVFTYMNL